MGTLFAIVFAIVMFAILTFYDPGEDPPGYPEDPAWDKRKESSPDESVRVE